MTENALIKPDYLFEVSWEVCNKVGGIHTVISTKALTLVNELGDNYICIGPDVWKETHEHPEFIEDNLLFANWKAEAAIEGLHFKVGRWKIAGSPVVILVDFTPYFSMKDKIFATFWEYYHLDSLLGQWDYIEPALFGYAAGRVIESFYEYNLSATDKFIAQFHEWMTGTGILHLKDKVPQAGLVFTTHATILGRTILGNGLPLYKDIASYKPEQVAKNFNVSAKNSLEKTSARECDCFTTVSEITGKECKQFLEREVDVYTPNGFEDDFVPAEDKFNEKRHHARKILKKVAEALMLQKLPEDTLFLNNSGRYEFRNKGIDLYIDALGKLNKDPELRRTIVAYITVPSHNTGPKQDVIDRLEEPDFTHPLTERYTTHWIPDVKVDPIMKRISENNLKNNPEDKVKIVFVPCYLDGNDGIFDVHYYDLLIGFDLTVYPSYYEPWGYTPLESLAFHVPAITTTLAGFGIWIKQHYGKVKSSGFGVQSSEFETNNGIAIIERTDDNNDYVVNEIVSYISALTKKSNEEIEKGRQEAFNISRITLWKNFIEYYRQAYSKALAKAETRADEYKGKQYKDHLKDLAYLRKIKPEWKKVLIYPEIPKGLTNLQELTMNLWWSWNYEAIELFEMIDSIKDSKIKDSKINGNHLSVNETKTNPNPNNSSINPIALLQSLTLEQLNELETNQNFLNKLKTVYEKFNNYMSKKPDPNEKLIAYFCMEFGLHSSLKIYSGGLGILAGDYLKEASDLNKNLIGIGLLYRYGYFNQKISLIGDQIDELIPQKFSQLPINPVRNAEGDWIRVGLALPGRTLYAKVWKVNVGRISLYLLDTDTEDNTIQDRNVTGQLYGGDWENRFKQELVLGVGGIRILSEMQIKPDIYHCNEGHGAFIGLERLRQYIQEGKYPYNEAMEIVRASTLFTTHTPVPAGHDSFSEDILRTYVPHYAERLNISWETFMNLGKMRENDPKEKFSMSVLACNLSQYVNAVSRIHCDVTKKMFNPLYDGYYPQELFIDYVTNGVHYQTWTNKEWQKFYGEVFDVNFINNLSDANYWKKIHEVDDLKIWNLRQQLRKELISVIKTRINESYTRRNENPKLLLKTIDALDDNALTIGFARRFATYKRAHLLFHNLERLDSIVNNKKCPVQFVFAGKAHPNDKAGQEIINRIIVISRMPQFMGKIVFIENYDIELAKKLVSGVDVWLNTPARLMEASGTSGQKAELNGVLNFSVADGWWVEGYQPGAGWNVKEEVTYQDEIFQNELDTEMLYNVFEEEIVPLFYERENGIPHKWLSYIKNSIADIAPHYTTKRMMEDYYSKFYDKLYERFKTLRENNFELVHKLAKWKIRLLRKWSGISVESISVPDSTKAPLRLGQMFTAEIVLNMNDVFPEDIGIEVVFGQKENDIVKEILFIEEMHVVETNGKTVKYSLNIPANRAGVYDYAFRIFPKNKLLPHRQDFNLIKWV